MSQIYIAAIVNVLAAVLPHIGVSTNNDALTTTIQTIILIGSSVWVLVRRYQKGDITALGARK